MSFTISSVRAIDNLGSRFANLVIRILDAIGSLFGATLKNALTRDRILAFLVGVFAFTLPFLVVGLDQLNEDHCPRSSISHYYYEPLAGIALVMILAFVGAFMIAFKGERHEENFWATLGGVGAIVLAVFPTADAGCAEASFDFVLRGVGNAETTVTQFYVFQLPGSFSAIAHVVGAGTLFVSLLALAVSFGSYHVRPVDEATRDHPSQYFQLGAIVVMLVGFVLILGSAGFLDWPWTQSIGGALAGLSLSENYDIERSVFHGEALFLMGFGAVFLTQSRYYLVAMVLVGFVFLVYFL